MPKLLAGSTMEEKLKLNHVVEGKCWRWTGAHMRKGYGQLWVAGKAASVHRLAYEAWVGPIPDDLEIDHTCNVRDCINPTHLELVTHEENVRRMSERRTHCTHGHELTEDNIKMRMGRHGRKYVSCRRCWNDRRRKSRAQRKAKVADVSA